jgi:hypothetical protein
MAFSWLLSVRHVSFRKSKLSTSNKLFTYKAILKPISTYGIKLWGTASTSNIEILERFQSKALRLTVDAARYVPNTAIRRDLQRRNQPLQLSIQGSPQRTPKRPRTTRQRAIAETPAKRSAYQVPSVIVLCLVLVCKSHSRSHKTP